MSKPPVLVALVLLGVSWLMASLDARQASNVFSSLVAYYALDEAGDADAIDAFDDHDMTESAGDTVASGAAVPTSSSASRDFELADTERLEVADHADFTHGDISLSVMCWINAESLGANAAVFAKGWQSDNNANQEWMLWQSTTTTTFNVASGVSPSSGATVASASTATNYMLVGGYDTVANQVFVARNAGTRGTASHSSTVNDGDRTLVLGARSDGGLPFDGLIDECGYWMGYALTEADEDWLYNSGAGRTYAEIAALGSAGATPKRLMLLGVGEW